MPPRPLVFACGASARFGTMVADALAVDLAPIEEREFEDGEHKARPMCSVREADCYVLQSLHSDANQSANDKLCRLLFFIATLRDHGARRVTAAVPYLAYARKDRRTKPRDPLNARYVAQLFEAMGADRLVTLETHNVVSLENAFRIPAHNLTIGEMLDKRMLTALVPEAQRPIVVASPDPGGVKRAQLFREALETRLRRDIGSAYMEKRRSAGVVSGSLLAGDVDGARVILVDDLISSGGTLARAARACREHGAEDVVALAAHGLFTEAATEALGASDVARVIVTDSAAPLRNADALAGKLEVVSAAPCFASAIRRLAGLESR